MLPELSCPWSWISMATESAWSQPLLMLPPAGSLSPLSEPGLVSREEQSWDWEHQWESWRKFILLLFLVQFSPDAELLELCGHFWGRKLLFARDPDAVGACVWAWSHEYRGFIWPWKEVHSMLLNENNNNNSIQTVDIAGTWCHKIYYEYLWVSEVTQSCPTLWESMDCSPPGSSVHGIFQVRILEWVAISFSRGSSQPRDWTWVSCIAGRRFTIWATREHNYLQRKFGEYTVKR